MSNELKIHNVHEGIRAVLTPTWWWKQDKDMMALACRLCLERGPKSLLMGRRELVAVFPKHAPIYGIHELYNDIQKIGDAAVVQGVLAR